MAGGMRSLREEPDKSLKRVHANAARLQNRMTGADKGPGSLASQIPPAQERTGPKKPSAKDVACINEERDEFGMPLLEDPDEGPDFG